MKNIFELARKIASAAEAEHEQFCHASNDAESCDAWQDRTHAAFLENRRLTAEFLRVSAGKCRSRAMRAAGVLLYKSEYGGTRMCLK